MIKKVMVWIAIIVLALLFLPTSLTYLYERIINMITTGELIGFYNYSPVVNTKYIEIVSSIKAFFANLSFKLILDWLKIIFSAETIIIISYILQFILIFYLIVLIWIDGSEKRFKESKIAILLIKITSRIVDFLEDIFGYIKLKFSKLLFIFLLCSGWLIVICFDSFIFLVDYFFKTLSVQSHLIFIQIFKFSLVMIVDFTINGNKFLVISFYLTLYFIIAFALGFKKIRINWACFKKLIANSATINVVDGQPGAGKTLTLAQAMLACTENMYDYLEIEILKTEIRNPGLNFAKVRLLLKIYYLDFEKEELTNIFKYNPNLVLELVKIYDYVNSDLSEIFFYQYYRSTCILTLMPEKDPYNNSFSRRLDLKTLRFFKKMDSFPYEPYTFMALPEIDKEFNSHDSKAEIGDDGTFASFALLSHLFDRTGHVFLDMQDKDQTIKRIRGIGGAYYNLIDRKIKMPTLLYVMYKPILWLYNGLLKLMLDYLGYREKTEKFWTVRKNVRIYKRNNLSFIYQLMKYIACVIDKVVGFFEKFQYFKIYAEFATNDEFRSSKIIKYNLNVMDFYHNEEKIYNSTQFKKFYSDLKAVVKDKGVKQNLMMIEKWSSLEPDIIEYSKTGQRNYSKIVLAQFEDGKNGGGE